MECLKILSYLMFFCIAKYFAKYCEWLKCHFFHALETHPEPHTYTKSLLASNKEASRSKTTAYLTLTWPEDRRKNLAIHLDQDLTSHWANLRLSHFSRKCSPCVHRWIVNKEIGNDCTGSGNTFAPSFCHLIVCTWAGLRLQQYKLFTQTQVLMLYHVRGCWH